MRTVLTTKARWRFGAAAGLVLLFSAIAGCKCEDGKAKVGAARVEATRYLPKSAEAAVVVPDLGVLGDRLTQLQGMKLATFAAQLQGFADANAFSNSLMQQAGVDLRSRDEMKKLGLAPDRGLGIALLPDDTAYAVVGISDEKTFGDALAKLAQSRLGAGTVNRVKVGALEHVTFSRHGANQPELGYVVVEGGFAIVSAGKGATRVPQFAALAKESSLSEDAALKASLGRLPKERDVLLHVPANVGAQRPGGLVGFTAAVRLDKDALRIHLDAPWPDSQQTLAALEPKTGAPNLMAELPQDAFLVARFNGDPLALDTVWPLVVGPHLTRAFREANFDIKQEVLANLEPGAVMSLSVSPTIPLGSGMPQVDVRRTNPFRYAHLVAYVKSKDEAKVTPLMSRMPEVAPKFGAKIEPVEKDGQRFFVTSYAQGEGVHFAQGGGRVVLASPLARLEQTVKTLSAGQGTPPPLLGDPELMEVLTGQGLGVVVDLNQLRASVRALPPEVYGVGGFAIRTSALRWLDATDDLRAITVGVTRKDTAVQAELALRFAKK